MAAHSWRRRSVIGVVLSLTIAVILLLPRSKVTKANFDKLDVGWTYQEVMDLLGPAHSSSTMKGHVSSPTEFFTNPNSDVQRNRGYRDYLHRQWTSAFWVTVGIFDGDKLVCRYGHEINESWLARVLGRVKLAFGLS